MIPRKFPGETAIVCGTGPSITPEIIRLVNAARRAGWVRVFGANRAHEIFECDVMHACNAEFYPLWWERIKDKPLDRWTTRPEMNGRLPGVEYIEERWEPGLSRDPSWIAAHHGTGPQLVNIAYLYGCERLLLVGWDMRFHGKTGPRSFERRRYLGEDPLTENHWPRTGPDGEMEGLIREMETINPDDYGIRIINCTRGSALKCFPMQDLRDALASP